MGEIEVKLNRKSEVNSIISLATVTLRPELMLTGFEPFVETVAPFNMTLFVFFETFRRFAFITDVFHVVSEVVFFETFRRSPCCY